MIKNKIKNKIASNGMKKIFAVIFSLVLVLGPITSFALSSTKDITKFSFFNITSTFVIDTTQTPNIITVTVPYNTNLTVLKPSITHTGASIFPYASTTQNFSNNKIIRYTVTAQDKSTKQYDVQVVVAPDLNGKEITSFSFDNFNPVVSGTIEQSLKRITLTLPDGASKTSLTPTIAVSSGATVSPASGTANNFTNLSVPYTVTSKTGSSQVYYVDVKIGSKVAPKAITSTSASEITANSAKLSGTINSGNATAKAWFLYDTSACPDLTCGTIKSTSAQNIGASYTDQAISANIGGSPLALTADTTYYFRVAIQQEATGSAIVLGKIESFKTLASSLTDPIAITTGSTFNGKDNSTTLNGTANLKGSAGTAYFQWGDESGYYDFETDHKKIESGNGETPINAVLDSSANLKAGTVYHFRLVAETSSKSAYGNDLPFQISGSGNTDSDNSTTQNDNFIPADLSTKGTGLIAECPDMGCGWEQLMITINNVIRFILFYFATPLAAICFAYAGFLYLTSGGNSESKGKAVKIIKNVLIGYVIALAAWLIVATILSSLGVAKEGIFLNIKN